MNGFLYDIKRTLTGKFTIIIVILLVLITGLTAYSVGVTSNSSTPGSVAIVMPYMNDTGHNLTISDYAINGYGAPVSGLKISSQLENFTGNGTTYVHIKGTTGSNGYFNTTVPYNSSTNYNYNIYLSYNDGSSVGLRMGVGFSNGHMSNYSECCIQQSYSISYSHSNGYSLYTANVREKGDGSAIKTMIFNRNYTSSTAPLHLYYNTSSTFNTNVYPNSNLNTKNVTGYGTMKSAEYTVILPLSIRNNGEYVNLYLANGTSGSTNVAPVAFTSFLYVDNNPGIALQGALVTFFGVLFVPILGIFSAYFYYSKDRASGIIESVIVRPITKGKLFLSRFIGTSVSFLAGIIIALAVADIILEHYTGAFISAGFFTEMLAGYLIEAIAFAGIIYLASQFIKSQGAVLGTGIGLLFALGFMWQVISGALLFLLKIKSTTSVYSKDSLILNAFSPSYFPYILADYYKNAFGTVTAASVGINIYSVIIIGIVWLLVPAGIAFYFTRKRD